MTWNQDLAEANWIQLGYIAANVGSMIAPLRRQSKVSLTTRDRELLRQQARYFDAAAAGWASFDQPTLSFQVPDEPLLFPTSALETAAEIYSSLHGGVLTDPEQFKEDLRSFGAILNRLAEGKQVRKRDAAPLGALEGFLRRLIDRAHVEVHKSSRTPQ